MTQKINLRVTEKTAQWLSATYPEATSDAEAVRMAILTARHYVLFERGDPSQQELDTLAKLEETDDSEAEAVQEG